MTHHDLVLAVAIGLLCALTFGLVILSVLSGEPHRSPDALRRLAAERQQSELVLRIADEEVARTAKALADWPHEITRAAYHQAVADRDRLRAELEAR